MKHDIHTAFHRICPLACLHHSPSNYSLSTSTRPTWITTYMNICDSAPVHTSVCQKQFRCVDWKQLCILCSCNGCINLIHVFSLHSVANQMCAKIACKPLQKAVHNDSQWSQLSEITYHNKHSLLQVEVIKAASLTWRQWHQNYYHGFGESVYEAFNIACKYLYCCGGSNSTDVSPIFIERSGDEARWADVLPAAETALKCLMPGNEYFIGDSSLQDRASTPRQMC